MAKQTLTRLREKEVWDRARLLREVYHVAPSLADAIGREQIDERDAMLLLLAALVHGPRKANSVVCIPKKKCALFTRRLRVNGIFRGDRVHGSYLGKNGGLSLVADSCVALGWLNRQ